MKDEAGFALIEMLVAMMLLSLVGLTLARFQTFQLTGSSNIALAAAARLEADNRAIDILVAPAAPQTIESGTSANAGLDWHWTATPGPSPDPTLMPNMVSVDVRLSMTPNGPPIARRQLLRPRETPRDPRVAGARTSRAEP